MSFNVSYSAGGVIDEVKKVNLPEELFPQGNTPKMKGLRLPIPAISGKYTITYRAPEGDINLVDASVACSGYHDGDYWELDVGNDKVCETMYTRELPENISQGNSTRIAYKVPKETEMKFTFTNISGTSKVVWFTLRYLYKKEGV